MPRGQRPIRARWITHPLSHLCLVLSIAAQAGCLVDEGRAEDSDDDWSSYGLTSSETRFSPLEDINTSNVARLTLAWSYDVPTTWPDGQEATPLVVDGTLFGVTNWSVVFAVDAETGREKWRWDPWVNRAAVEPEVCCGVVNRGLAFYRGLIYVPVIDGRLQALDAATGRVVWEARLAFPQDHYTLTMAPRIAKGKVIIGASGGDLPTRGFFDAYDALTGQRVWRVYTVPGDPSKPFENEAMRRAAATWDKEWWKNGGGGAVWDGMAYDPEEGLVYVGTGNALPWAHEHRSSKDKDNLYVSSILAVDVGTGELRWHYQVVPGDNWDYDSAQQLVLAELDIAGRTRKVIMQASKSGFFYVLDRVTGEFISAKPFARVTWATGIDPNTGRPLIRDEAYYGTQPIRLSPGPSGAHTWAPMAFNPLTGLVYVPTATNSTGTYAAEPEYDPVSARERGLPTGTVRPQPAPVLPSPPAIGPPPVDENPPHALVAWDPVRQAIRWRRAPGGRASVHTGGALTTAGNLVFHVVNSGRLIAYSADTGEKLLDLDTGLRNGMGPPITYRVDGTQYVALMGGVAVEPVSVSGDAQPVSPKLLAFAVADPS